MDPADLEHVEAPRRRSSRELALAVRDGRRIGDALLALVSRAQDPDDEDLALAAAFARFLVRRCDQRHQGWQVVRALLIEHGADVPWERAERQAYGPTTERVLEDCGAPGRTPLVRVQHAAAEERVRAVAPYADARIVLKRLELVVDAPVVPDAWAHALVEAVTARSREKAITRIAGVLGARRK